MANRGRRGTVSYFGKELPVPTEQEARWSLQLVQMFWKKDTFPMPARNQTPACPARNIMTVLTELSWLLYKSC